MKRHDSFRNNIDFSTNWYSLFVSAFELMFGIILSSHVKFSKKNVLFLRVGDVVI